MKILYLMPDTNGEYLGTMLYHGLCELDDIEIYIDNPLPWYYLDYTGNKATLYGKGFNYAGLVNPEKRLSHTKTEIMDGIENHYYDVVIYGAVYRYRPYLEEVFKYYKKEEIVFIDGADEDYGWRKSGTVLFGLLKENIPFWYLPISMMLEAMKLRKKGLYFKREISTLFTNKFIPIQFAIPEELILEQCEVPKKEQVTATIIPGKLETYIYDNMEEYNHGYAVSCFGVTTKKAGWDCLRHYEILANGCIPYFPKIQRCPKDTMFMLPKRIFRYTNKLYKEIQLQGGHMTESQYAQYEYYQKMLLKYTRDNLSTKALAEYVLAFIC